jgi:Ribbon-helix-helix protein, copG family
MPTKKRVFSVLLEVDQIEALRREQQRTGATPGEIIRRAVRAFLGQKKASKR